MWKLTALFLFSALTAVAQSSSAKTVAALCQSAINGGSDLASCSGYVGGVLDADLLWYSAMLKEKHFSLLANFYCAPTTLQTKDAAKLFVDWLKQNPKHEDDPAANVIVLALRDKYPCK